MEFKEYPFSELLKNIVDNRGRTCPVEEDGMPLIATNCIKNECLYPVYEKIRFVSDETYKNWFRGHPEPGDIIFVCKGSPGRVAWTPNPVPFCIAQDMVAIRADETKIHPKFLFALLRSQATQNQILNMHVGTLIPHFKKGDFKNLFLTIPDDLEYQEKVGEIYFQFFEKIENNTQTNQTLEQIAQAIFKSWFVDFEPVKAKMAAKAKLPSPSGRGAGGEGAGAEDTKNHHKKTPKHLLTNARNLRQSATDAEQLLWKLLRGRQVNNAKFRRQHPVGKYILDFYCHDLKLAIELDGSQHSEADYKQKDTQRTSWLNQQGIRVIRFWNNQVLQETEAVMEMIYNTVTNPPSPLTPLPEGEGNNEHPSVTLAAMSAISGKDETALKQLQAEQPEAYAELAQTAALFPSAMVESELGEIPEGWIYEPVINSAEFINGAAYKNIHFSKDPDAKPVIKIAELKNGITDNTKFTNTELGDKFKLDTRDILFSWSGSPETSIDTFIWTGGKALLNQHIFKVVNKTEEERCFTYWLLKFLKPGFIEIAKNKQTTGLGHVTRKDMERLNFCKPNEDVVKLFYKSAGPILGKIENNLIENNTLAETRDELLPKLLAGEIHPHPSPLPKGEGLSASNLSRRVHPSSPLPLGEDLGEGQP